jgi:hypothetical protein
MTSNNKDSKINWISARASEPEFLSFLKASDEEDAKSKAFDRCCGELVDGVSTEEKLKGITDTAFNAFKQEYLTYFRVQLGLPATAGRM